MQTGNFADLGISPELCRALDGIGYETPTPIQAQAIPMLLDGRDLLGVAQTGTGKTAAFALPLLQFLDELDEAPRPHSPRALILAPTRELAIQIHDEIISYGKHLPLTATCVFGGVGQNPQVQALKKGVDVLVATPGRLLDLAGQRLLDLGDVEVLVLDEADRLLDMGFVRDVKRIVALVPDKRQSLLFSATMPKEVVKLASSMLKSPLRVDVSPRQVTVREIAQRVVMVPNRAKTPVLVDLLGDSSVTRAMVFTRTKHGANKLAKKLNAAGIGAEAIHGNKSQNARQRALAGFKKGDIWVLVATDIAARGIDVDAVSHVFNYELNHEPESYVHRIGRTGRAGATGVAWTLVDPEERPRLKAVERLIGFSPERVEVEIPAFEDTPEPDRDTRNGGTRSDRPRQIQSVSEDAPRKRRRRRRRAA